MKRADAPSYMPPELPPMRPTYRLDVVEAWCPTCSEIDWKGRNGGWVSIFGEHEHEFPEWRPKVYVSQVEPMRWEAHLPLWHGNGWLGAKEFDTQPEAMDFAATVLWGIVAAGRPTASAVVAASQLITN